jgi:uncharacterized protein (TIGR03790 family)
MLIVSAPSYAGTSRALVVENLGSPTSITIARYYMLKRHIPAVNLCPVNCTTDESCSTVVAESSLFTPIRKYISIHHLDIDYIVLTKDIPIRFSSGPWTDCSIDSVMVELDDPLGVHSANPYFAATDRFTHSEYGIYLVTRLTGWTLSDCLRLIDNGLASLPGKGPIYLHPAPDKDVGGYAPMNEAIRVAWAELSEAGINVDLDQTANFHRTTQPLAGYFTWGSNDPNFDKALFKSLAFSPGAIAETVVSTSGRTFENPDAPGQSLVADLIHDGVSGCKGYVSEPYVDAMALPNLLFDRYTSGWNLADSFYASSRYACWKDIVIGDPFCCPYAKKK